MSIVTPQPVQWGNVTLPDLVTVVLELDLGLISRETSVVRHEPTGLIVRENSMNQDRGQGPREFVIYLLGTTQQALRLVVEQADRGVFVGTRDYLRTKGIIASDLTYEEEKIAEREYLYQSGMKFKCIDALPEHDFSPIRFTNELRDAAVRLLCIELTRYYRTKTNPFPMQLDFRPKGIPKKLHGNFSNPFYKANL